MKYPVFHERVRVIDIDGTVLKKRDPEHYFTAEPEALEDAVEQVNEWFDNGDYIVFWTARPSSVRDKTMNALDRLGFKYHEVIFDKPYSYEIHIYDDNPIFIHKVERDIGIGKL
ncbi:MAG: hypothetical protein DRN26_01535 [Thermoplasmata archaeon]|nr:MAG: hypothetical protein DRN26_01535 [Thermoplasmata archaeon]